MGEGILPGQVRRLAEDESFRFRCHPGIGCFTECCRQLELALTPYDVLRLKCDLGISSGDFLERYAVVERREDDIFPQVYLAMLADGRGSCPFVTPEGCRVYQNRPGACRIYPLGRGAFQTADGGNHDIHVLLTESHCRGHAEPDCQTARQWSEDQGLLSYNRYNDLLIEILQHEKVKAGISLDEKQIEKFTTALYDLDDFRTMVQRDDFSGSRLLTREEYTLIGRDDAALLRFGVHWLRLELFGELEEGYERKG